MKATKIIWIVICLFFAGQIYAAGANESMKEHTDSWLQDSNEPTLKGSRALDETERGTLDAPASDALYVLLTLAGIYMFIRKRKDAAHKK